MRITQLSPPRTGSTLVFNILQYLFENQLEHHYKNTNKKVSKNHTAYIYDQWLSNQLDVYVVVTIRHPLDAFCSAVKLLPKEQQQSKYHVIKELCNILAYYDDIHNFLQRIPCNRILLLRYEDFILDMNKIFIPIEKFFSISISKQEQRNMKRFFSLTAMKNLSKKYVNFDTYHPIIGIHGDHIHNGKTQIWKEEIPKKWEKDIFRISEDIIKQWSY